MEILLPIALLIAALGLFILFWARRKRTETGLPSGKVIYSDTGDWETPEKPLFSRRYGLVGRPDYLVRTVEDGASTLPSPSK
ncbi:MAG: hypothetical protein R2856_27435 [Caldilineaceae bacterium]